MKMSIFKIFPQNDQLLCDLYHDVKENLDYYVDSHHDTSVTVEKEEGENCILIKSLKLEDSVN